MCITNKFSYVKYTHTKIHLEHAKKQQKSINFPNIPCLIPPIPCHQILAALLRADRKSDIDELCLLAVLCPTFFTEDNNSMNKVGGGVSTLVTALYMPGYKYKRERAVNDLLLARGFGSVVKHSTDDPGIASLIPPHSN